MKTHRSEMDGQAAEAHAARIAYEALAAALINLPEERIITDIARIAHILEVPIPDASLEGVDEQRFYDRFFVSSSPLFVPLSESCLREAVCDEGVWRFGPTSGPQSDHAASCYRAAGFQPRLLEGHPLAIASMRDDSLAIELAFMAHLARAESKAAADSRERLRDWQKAFLASHLGSWIHRAASVMIAGEDDFYARVCMLAAAWIDMDQERRCCHISQGWQKTAKVAEPIPR